MSVDESEPSSFGTLLYAEKYRIAGERVIGNAKPSLSPFVMPAYNCLGISIELSFKAFLLSKGMTDKVLRYKPFGHRLDALMRKATELGLGDFVALDEDERLFVEILNVPYEKHDFRYITLGAMELPYWSLASGVAYRLTDGLHDHCLAHLVGEEAAAKRVSIRGRFGELKGN